MTMPLESSCTSEKLRLQIQKPIADPTSPNTTPYVARVMDTLLAAADRNLGAIWQPVVQAPRHSTKAASRPRIPRLGAARDLHHGC